jgi:Tfp pilus assembly protein PilV
MNLLGTTLLIMSMILIGVTSAQDQALQSVQNPAQKIIMNRLSFELASANIKTQFLHPEAISHTAYQNANSISCRNNFGTDQANPDNPRPQNQPGTGQNQAQDQNQNANACRGEFHDLSSLRGPDGQVYLNTNQDGFNLQGQVCSLSLNEECPIRVDLDWNVSCDGTCDRLSGQLSVQFSSLYTNINLTNFNFVVDL